MKEIIYIQAGEFSNYTGTHFWNTQEAYFTYEDYEEPLTSYDISFREGISLAVRPFRDLTQINLNNKIGAAPTHSLPSTSYFWPKM